MKVLALVPYPPARAPGQRYRIEQWAPKLALSGIAVTFRPFLRPWGMDVLHAPKRTGVKAVALLAGITSLLRQVSGWREFDAVYVYREAALLGPPVAERYCAQRLPVVYDFDDALYEGDVNPANRLARWLRPRTKTAALCHLATHVLAGNEVLASFARSHASEVTVVPSTIDTDLYSLAPRAPNLRPVVGWTGSPTTARYLQAFLPTLRRLKSVIDFELRVIGASVDLRDLDGECLPWRAATEVEDLRTVDVGLMPLSDDAWSRGKCGMKALQYMGLGIPPVVSPVGANAAIVRDGRNGFHARTEMEWIDRTAALLRDPELRARLGHAARQTVEREYSATTQVPRLQVVFTSLHARRHR